MCRDRLLRARSFDLFFRGPDEEVGSWENGADYVAASFIRTGANVRSVIAYLERCIQELSSEQPAKEFMRPLVISKIENKEGLDNFDEILHESDGIMVARGDLGVEIPMQQVPVLQKKISEMCLLKAKPVIVATQMLESMIENVTPTRAEVNDVANSVMDGADAVMLSGETSVGEFPLEAVEVMHKIVADVEKEFRGIRAYQLKEKDGERYISDAICYHSCKLAEQVGVKAIVTMTHSGYNTIQISSHRPPCKIYAFTNNHAILNTLSLVWGVTGFYFDNDSSTDDTVLQTKKILKELKNVNEGDLILNVASMPIKEKGMTNMMKLSYVK